MNRILAVQLTRIGDTLQSTSLLAGLKEKYPDSHIAVLVRPALKRVLDNNPSVDEIVVFDTQPLLDSLIKEESLGFVRSYDVVRDLVAELRAKRFDVAINLTHSRLSAILLRLIDCPDTRGLALSSDWMRVIRGSWQTYFINSVFNRAYNDFNIVDVYRRFGNCDLPACPNLVMPITDDDRTYTDGLLREQGIAGHDRYICFQLGASDSSKQWPTDSFAALGDMLVREMGVRIVLVGTESERPLGSRVRAAMKESAAMMFGNTNLAQLAALLERAEFLVTNDTGVMHVASAADTPIIALSFSYVYFRETGPYGEGHVVVQAKLECAPCRPNQPCSHQRCKGYIRPEHVIEAVRIAGRYRDGSLEQVAESRDNSSVGYYVSRFGDDGLVEYWPVIRRQISIEELVNIVYRGVWRDSLDGVSSRPDDIRSALTESLAAYTHDNRTLLPAIEQCTADFRRFAALAEQGIAKARQLTVLGRSSIDAETQRSIQAMVKTLTGLDLQLAAEGRAVDAVRPLAALFSFEKENLEGTDFRRLTEGTLDFYTAAAARAHAMADQLDIAADLMNSQ